MSDGQTDGELRESLREASARSGAGRRLERVEDRTRVWLGGRWVDGDDSLRVAVERILLDPFKCPALTQWAGAVWLEQGWGGEE